MTQEEKAKAYDEALERAQKATRAGSDVAMDIVRYIFPQLAESEDERIIKTLQEYVKNRNWPLNGPTQEEVLAWLEKQKEQNEELVYRLNGLMQDYIKEGKDDEEKEHRLKCYQLFWDALEDTNFFEQKKQTAEEVDESTKRLNDNWMKQHFDDYKERKPAEKSSMLKILKEHLANTPREQLDAEFEVLKDLTIDKPVEWGKPMLNGEPIPTENHSVDIPLAKWGEEDEKMISTLVSYVEDPSCWNLKCPREKLVAFIESLPERFNLQSKQERSKEDEEMFDAFMHKLEVCDLLTNKEIMWAKLRLKSLRPQPKVEWSEEDEKMRQSIIKDIEFDRNFTEATTGKVIERYNEQIAWLKDIFLNHKKCIEAVDKLCSNKWSEEDEKDIAHITRILDDCYAYGKHDLSKTDHENLVNKLKSLCPQPKQKINNMITPNKEFFQWIYNRLVDVHKENPNVDYMLSFKRRIEELSFDEPSWKPSEQEKGALRTAIYVLTEERNFPKAAANLQAILDAFDGKESRKDWKPSEEQIRTLDIVISDYRHACTKGSDEKAEILKSILERFKKL